MSALRAEGGQALVVVALAFGVLLGALSLAADWGHGLAMRRVSQNQADAATLAAGKLLAASFGPSAVGEPFQVTQDDVWTYAACAAIENRGFDITRQTETVAIRFGRVALPDPTVVWTAPFIDTPPPSCPAVPTRSGIPVPADARYVEVRAETTFTTLFGAVTRRDVVAGASARARLSAVDLLGPVPIAPTGDARVPGPGMSGAPGPRRVPIWPIVRHFNKDDYEQPCGQYCDPNARDAQRITFWRNGGDPESGKQERIFGGFRGLVDFSHNSLRAGAHQLLTDSDRTGSTVNANQPRCPLGTWDTRGTAALADSVSCNVTNWAYYGFRGGVGLGTDWANPDWVAFAAGARELQPTRASCGGRSDLMAPPYFPAPSCTGSPSRRGDWIETYPSPPSGTEFDDLTARMREFIAREGRTLPWSANQVARGPNRGNTYGKAALVYLFLFDCAETFTSTWTPTESGGDCSVLDASAGQLDRVHLFTVAPFLFYEGLVTSRAVEAYWGGAFGDPGVCRPDGTGCRDLDPLKNTAFLVPVP